MACICKYYRITQNKRYVYIYVLLLQKILKIFLQNYIDIFDRIEKILTKILTWARKIKKRILYLFFSQKNYNSSIFKNKQNSKNMKKSEWFYKYCKYHKTYLKYFYTLIESNCVCIGLTSKIYIYMHIYLTYSFKNYIRIYIYKSIKNKRKKLTNRSFYLKQILGKKKGTLKTFFEKRKINILLREMLIYSMPNKSISIHWKNICSTYNFAI